MSIKYKINTKKKLKVLHLASFLGNIGDYANHRGFYKMFRKVAPVAEFTQVEIRKFYKNRSELKFDNNFLKQINNHDLLVLGGGGFFDLQWDYSNTGTTVDFTEEFINGIKIPVLVNAMGYHEYEEVKEKNVKKFKNFLNIILNKDNWFVSVRNDGSFERMFSRYGKLVNKVLKVPDSGFFYSPKRHCQLNLKDKNTIWIGLNITNDLFNKNFNKDLDVDTFNNLFGQFISQVLKENKNYKIIFFPHAHQDLITISIILNKLDDKYKREKIMVAPFVTQENSIDQVFDLYRLCLCVVGMRFHTNVCSVGMGTPSIGLAGHEQVSALYRELYMPERCVKLDNINFISELRNKLFKTIKSKNKIRLKYLQTVKFLDK